MHTTEDELETDLSFTDIGLLRSSATVTHVHLVLGLVSGSV